MRASQIRLSLFAAVAAALFCGSAAARERPATTPVAQFLHDTIERALDLVRPPVSPEAGAELAILIEGSMDWQALTRFAVGHYRAALSEDGMSSATNMLAQRLEILARRVGTELPAMTVAIRDIRIDPDGHRRVLSTATVPRFGEVEVEWTLAPAAGGYQIADIKALGMTLRQFLRSWITSLVAARGGDAAAAFGDGVATSPQ